MVGFETLPFFSAMAATLDPAPDLSRTFVRKFRGWWARSGT